MRTGSLLLIATVICLLFTFTGCQNSGDINILLVSFEENTPITYQLTSTRKTEINLTGSGTKKNRPQIMTETLDMVVTYTPVEVDPFGLTTIKATCQSVKVKRTSMSGKRTAPDAMEKMAGKTFMIRLTPTGQIAEYTDLDRTIREIGKHAFDTSKTQRVKNPDMISDFIAMQWYLWDSISTIKKPDTGVDPNDTWTAKQLIPWPAPIPNPPARITTYMLESFSQEENQPQKANIKSSFTLSDTTVEGFPRPYDGRFQMRGLMGFLQNYRFQSLEGTGTQVFNMETGQIESDQQQYQLKVNASFLLPLGNSVPTLTIDQTISIKKIKTPE